MVGDNHHGDVPVIRADDVWPFESTVRTRVLPDVGSGTLTTRLQAYSYLAVATRYAESISTIGGTGLVTPILVVLTGVNGAESIGPKAARDVLHLPKTHLRLEVGPPGWPGGATPIARGFENSFELPGASWDPPQPKTVSVHPLEHSQPDYQRGELMPATPPEDA